MTNIFKTLLVTVASFLIVGCARNPYYGAQPYSQWPAPGSGQLPNLPDSSLQPPTTSGVPPVGATRPFPNIQRPDWSNPGTIEQQQARASLHDPYPDNNAATPIEGGRPRDFSTPRSEATRSSQGVRWPF